MERNLKYDVVVVGGGAAGISAAIGAKKSGKSVILIERNSCLGGQATNANVASYCGFFTHGDEPKQIIGGVGQMVLDKLSAIGKYDGYRLSTVGNAIIPLDSEALKFVLDELVLENEIPTLLYCTLIKTKTENSKITMIECVDDIGSIFIEGKTFVDASGDGNLAYLAGAEIIFGNPEGITQMSTNIMRIGNFDINIKLSPEVIEKAIQAAKKDGFKNLSKDSGIIFKAEQYGYAILPSVQVESLDCSTLTACEMNTRRQAQEYIEAFRKYIPGMENCTLISTGPKLGIRESRHIVGKYTLSLDEVLNAVKNKRGIARGAWPCENHQKLDKMAEYLWVKDNDYYEIPIDILLSKNIKNLWSAGRTVSADSMAFASVRVMGISFGTGHAAGVGAAYMAEYEDIDVDSIRIELKKQGAIL
ncbi:FAD-dependent oxidoreductase [Fusobacterium varium]|uniref:FAD-dependent oxidoreductase n=1 Tax=Fusobacterium varium TaxID=856 RepID=UPI000BBAACAA|nr:FAD-dependent oxidoreductase [uncultured Fusobacterium sp.]BBA51722.1 putative FAD dependent oxidoreductase [Fusobacterium varium]